MAYACACIYAFSGKGTLAAVVKTLDELNFQASNKKCILLALWDFSNAFCTFIHDAAITIARKMNFSKKLLDLFILYLDQTTSIIKMSDKNGYQNSATLSTNRGLSQGQRPRSDPPL